MQASLTSVFSLEVDPRQAALLETEEAIGIVVRESQVVELAPQSAYVRRLQHQMAERANLVSRSRAASRTAGSASTRTRCAAGGKPPRQ